MSIFDAIRERAAELFVGFDFQQEHDKRAHEYFRYLGTLRKDKDVQKSLLHIRRALKSGESAHSILMNAHSDKSIENAPEVWLVLIQILWGKADFMSINFAKEATLKALHKLDEKNPASANTDSVRADFIKLLKKDSNSFLRDPSKYTPDNDNAVGAASNVDAPLKEAA
jgi:hypothetical protein